MGQVYINGTLQTVTEEVVWKLWAEHIDDEAERRRIFAPHDSENSYGECNIKETIVSTI